MIQKIILESKVIGIEIDYCLVCGKKPTTRHHVIPKEFKPQQNVTIPLCHEHKNIMHHIIKQFYFPKELRIKINKSKKHCEDTLNIINSIRKELQFHNHKSPKVFLEKG